MLKLRLPLNIPNAHRRTYTTPTSIQEWITSTLALPQTVHHDTIDPLRASHLLRTLPTRQHLPPPAVYTGDELGKGHSMIYFQPETMLNDLGSDGSSTEYNAPHPYTRRMWAGGSFTWPQNTEKNRILRIGNEVLERRSIAKIEYKEKGDMVFIHQQRTIWNRELQDQEDMWGVKEIRTHVFRPPSLSSPSSTNTSSLPSTTSTSSNPNPEANTSTTPTSPITYTNERPNPDISFTYTPSSPLLFRYSALTFNAHKIHYDIQHTTSHENQKTLLVHGPLTATLLIELAVQAGLQCGKELLSFDYRAVGPIFVNESVEMVGWWVNTGVEMEARQDGRVGMKASAHFL